MLLGIGPGLLPRQAADPAAGAATCRRSRSAAGATSPAVRAALQVNPLFADRRRAGRRHGLGLRATPASGLLRAHGRRQRPTRRAPWATRSTGVRIAATAAGGFLAGVGGAFLSLFYPGSWNEGLSSGQGLMAVALVIFARWDPLRCICAALLFGGAGAHRPGAAVGRHRQGYYLFNAAPYVLTLLILIARPAARAARSRAARASCRSRR